MKLLILATIVACAAAHIIEPMQDELWREYKLKFGKFYKTREEELKRYLIFKGHLNDIQVHNGNPTHKFKKGINHFHDLVRKQHFLNFETFSSILMNN